MTTAAQIEEIQRQAYDEAFALGRQEGMEKGQAEMQARIRRLESIIDLLESPLRELDEQLVDEMNRMVLIIARHVIRREIRADPAQVMGVIRQAAEVLPVGARSVRLYLHPEDATLVKELTHRSEEDAGSWKILDDPAMMRGGCRVETESSRIDASIEKRLAMIATELLGGAREGDDVHSGD